MFAIIIAKHMVCHQRKSNVTPAEIDSYRCTKVVTLSTIQGAHFWDQYWAVHGPIKTVL